MSPLRALEAWYARNCDGDWEHSFGATIETLDNPGWAVRIDLAETALAGRPFEAVRIDRSPRVASDQTRSPRAIVVRMKLL